MSIPSKHHYLPAFFIKRWVNEEGEVFQYTKPHDRLDVRRKTPKSTGYIDGLYSIETAQDPVARQHLELNFLQRVDSDAAKALKEIEEGVDQIDEPKTLHAWTRFLLTLLHRGPDRVAYFDAKAREFEKEQLADFREHYASIRGENDPATFDDYLSRSGEIAPELRVKDMRMVMDSEVIGNTLLRMRWSVIELTDVRWGLLTGDNPLMMSNGLGHANSFVVLPVSPTSFFIAAKDPTLPDYLSKQPAHKLELAFNDATVKQSRHLVIGQSNSQTRFIENRFGKFPPPEGALQRHTWNSPIWVPES